MKIRNVFALFVGINKYCNSEDNLYGCVNDVKSVLDFLEDHYKKQSGFEFIPKLLTDEEATRLEVIQAFNHFNKAEDDDICLFYYAGHGSRVLAPTGFQQISQRGKLNSIVCHDSRGPGGMDLLDKELSYLIWKVVKDKNLHFLSIMDCCHSRTNTRFYAESKVTLRERMRSSKNEARALNTFEGYESFDVSNPNFIKVPIGKHIAISACSENETAKEVEFEGRSGGVFSFCLLEVLQSHGTRLPYKDLVKQVRLMVKVNVKKQAPQIEFIGYNDKNATFLDQTPLNTVNPFVVRYEVEMGSWTVNAGVFGGVRKGSDKYPTLFEEADTKQELEVVKVFPHLSQISGMPAGSNRRTIHYANLKQLSTNKILVSISPRFDIKLRQQLEAILLEKPSECFEIVDHTQQAKYQIHSNKEGFYVTYKNYPRKLIRVELSHGRLAIIDLINRLNKVARWEQLYKLGNSNSSISHDSYQVQFFRTTSPNEYHENTLAERMLTELPISLPYLSDGENLHKPGFKIKIKNTSNKNLWFSILYMGDRYEIHAIMPNERLIPNQEKWITNIRDQQENIVHIVQLEEIYHKYGLTSINEYLKVVICTHEIQELIDLEQSPFEWEDYLGTKRGYVERQRIRAIDWTTDLLEFTIINPLPLYSSNQPNGYGQLGIRVDWNPEILGKYGLLPFDQAFPISYWGDFIFKNDTLFESFEMVEGLKNTKGLSVLAFYDISDLPELQSDLIRLTFDLNRIKNSEIRPTPYEWDPEKKQFHELIHKWEENQLILRSLPQRCYKGYFEENGPGRFVFLHI